MDWNAAAEGMKRFREGIVLLGAALLRAAQAAADALSRLGLTGTLTTDDSPAQGVLRAQAMATVRKRCDGQRRRQERGRNKRR